MWIEWDMQLWYPYNTFINKRNPLVLDIPIISTPIFVFLMPRLSPRPHQLSCLAKLRAKTLLQILHIVFFIVWPPLTDNLFTYNRLNIACKYNSQKMRHFGHWFIYIIPKNLTNFCIIPLSRSLCSNRSRSSIDIRGKTQSSSSICSGGSKLLFPTRHWTNAVRWLIFQSISPCDSRIALSTAATPQVI